MIDLEGFEQNVLLSAYALNATEDQAKRITAALVGMLRPVFAAADEVAKLRRQAASDEASNLVERVRRQGYVPTGTLLASDIERFCVDRGIK